MKVIELADGDSKSSTTVFLDGPTLVVSTPKIRVEFDEETEAILRFLSDISIMNPLFIIELLGGKEWFKEQIRNYKKVLRELSEAEGEVDAEVSDTT